MAGPCPGLTVLDVSWGMPGARCTLVMADYGAEGIEVEPPGGDPFRFPPAWMSWNRGKQGIGLDLRTTAGREHALHLAGAADVLGESCRPGDMADGGLADETLAHLYPRLVYCAITGVGHQGPLRRVNGYEGGVAAKAGRMRNLPGQPTRAGPVSSAVSPGSGHASQAAVRGSRGALRVWPLCGRGQWVQTSLVQALASPHDNSVGDGGLVQRQLRRRDPQRFAGRPGGGRGLSSLGDIPVRTKDGTWLQHATQRLPHSQGHLKAMGLGHLCADARVTQVPALSVDNRERRRRELLQTQGEKTADAWRAMYLQDGNIAAEPYRTSIQAMDQPAGRANGTVVTIPDPRLGPLRTLAPLVECKDTPGEPSGPAPAGGQHTAAVLGRWRPRAAAATVLAHPLSGVTLLDLATIQAGPDGAALLADLGARVSKSDATDRRVEAGRRATAQAVADARTSAGKACLQVDLQPPEGTAIVHRLSAKADGLVHTDRLGVPERLQVEGATGRQLNPRLVHVWMGTYGAHGGHARRLGAHPIPGAVMGGARRQMGRGMPPPPEALRAIEEIVEASRWIMQSTWGPDQNTAPAIATGILLGLRARDLTGKGQPVHLTMRNAKAWATADEDYDHANRPPLAMPDAELHGLHALYRRYRCRAGWVFLGCLLQDEGETCCRTGQRGDLLADRRVATRAARQAHDAALRTEIAAIFAGRSAAEWEELLIQADLGGVRADDALAGEFYAHQPPAKAKALSGEVEHPSVGTDLRYGGLVECALTPGRYRTASPIGQPTKPLRRELGYDDQPIEDWGRRGIVQWAEPSVGGEP